jgi:Myb-like DNA-binding domain
MLVTFPTRKSWSEHELTQHRIWHNLKCHLCSTRLTAENTLSEHLQLKHDLPQRLSKLFATSSLAKSSERVSLKEEQCPLCLQRWSDQRKFVTHLGRHLEEIALSVLPREVDCDSDQQSDDCGTSEDANAPWSPSCQRKLPKEHMQQAHSGPWSTQDDEVLVKARNMNLPWATIHANHFPTETANTCRKRYEQLVQRRRGTDSEDANAPWSPSCRASSPKNTCSHGRIIYPQNKIRTAEQKAQKITMIGTHLELQLGENSQNVTH